MNSGEGSGEGTLYKLTAFAQAYMQREQIHQSHVGTFQSLLVHIYFLRPKATPLGDLLSPPKTDMSLAELLEWVDSYLELPADLRTELEIIALLQGGELP